MMPIINAPVVRDVFVVSTWALRRNLRFDFLVMRVAARRKSEGDTEICTDGHTDKQTD